MRTYQATIGEYLFDVTEEGPQNAPAVVLLHGFPQTSASFGHVARLLAEDGLRTVALDQRGYSPGARPLEVSAYAMPELVGDVLGLLDVLGLPSADLVGHDWGSLVAWSVAATAPDRIRTLTAVSVPHPRALYEILADAGEAGEEQRQRSSYVQLFRMEDGKPEEVLLGDDARALRGVFDPLPEESYEPHVAAMSRPGTLTAALNWYRAIDPKDSLALPAVTVPTTFVWSTADIAIGRAAAERCAEYVTADYRFVELEGISHWIPDQAPEALARAVADRVRSVNP
jgi:pimeloyl-ACP methyl ester carboxylesterase